MSRSCWRRSSRAATAAGEAADGRVARRRHPRLPVVGVHPRRHRAAGVRADQLDGDGPDRLCAARHGRHRHAVGQVATNRLRRERRSRRRRHQRNRAGISRTEVVLHPGRLVSTSLLRSLNVRQSLRRPCRLSRDATQIHSTRRNELHSRRQHVFISRSGRSRPPRPVGGASLLLQRLSLTC